jgi:GntR family transcriptional regulator
MTPLSPQSPEPLYLQLANELRSAIRRGELQPGGRLPPERDLVATYGVSRETVRQGLDVLKAEALIGSGPGRGTFIRQPPPVRFRFTRHGLAPGVSPWEQATRQAGVEGSGRVTSVDQLRAGPEAARHLAIEEGSPVVVRRGEMLIGGFVAQLFAASYPLELVRGTELVGPAAISDGIYAALDRAGMHLDTYTEEISARAPTPEEASALRLGLGVPVLTIVRTTSDVGGQPVEFLETVSNPEMLLFVYEGLPLGRPVGKRRRRTLKGE